MLLCNCNYTTRNTIAIDSLTYTLAVFRKKQCIGIKRNLTLAENKFLFNITRRNGIK